MINVFDLGNHYMCGEFPSSPNENIDKGKLSYIPDNLYNLDNKINNLKLNITFLKLDYIVLERQVFF